MKKNIHNFHIAMKDGDSFREIGELKEVTLDYAETEERELSEAFLKPIEVEMEIKLNRAQRRRFVRKEKKATKRYFKKQKVLF